MNNVSNIVSKLIIGSALVLSLVPSALANEENTLRERNTYLFSAGADARPITHPQGRRLGGYRAIDAMGYAAAEVSPGNRMSSCATNEGYGRFSYESC